MKILRNQVLQSIHNKPILIDVFYKDNNTPKPVVIFCHGYKGFKDWGAWNIMAKTYAEAGFFFIKFNFSHNGGTIQQPIDFPDLEAFGNNNYIKELDDLETVINWIFNSKDYKNEIDLTNVSLIGHSRGGGIVLLKTNEDKRVKKVITLASVCDFGKRTATVGDLDQWEKEGVKYVVNGRTKQNMPHYYQFYENYIENKERLDIKNATSKLRVPHLLIHGDKDTSVSIKEAENLKKWNPVSEYHIVKNADHVFNTKHPWLENSLSKELEEVTKKCIHFLKN
ncbi:MAG: alpha/beta fold hydrolase [Flavobacteriaceae bacterium]|nr:alpha/beta fold hydrolase [Flavobacteriaceae bacterium]